MYLFPVLIFFALLNVSASEPCGSNIIQQNESFYRNLSKSPNDRSLIKEYIKAEGNCFKKGVHLVEKRGVPILEYFVCGDSIQNNPAEYFFFEGKLCHRTAKFFPSRDVFYIDEVMTVSSVAEGWGTVTSKNSTLFYKKSGQFNEMQSVGGRILNIPEEGLFTNDIQRPVFPYFIFKKGEWRQVLPLREFFHLTVNDDLSFNISIITESSLSFEKEELVNMIGLKSEMFQVETPRPSRYLISGKNISGVRIPKLKMGRSGNSFHGRYIIRLSVPGINEGESKSFKEDLFEITVNNEKGTLSIELTVFAKDLGTDDIERILAAVNREIPPFHIIKENGK